MKDESLAKVIEDMRKRADVAERQDADGQVHHSAVAVMLRDFADRIEASLVRSVLSDGRSAAAEALALEAVQALHDKRYGMGIRLLREPAKELRDALEHLEGKGLLTETGYNVLTVLRNEDSVALVPARLALNLCRAIGEKDRARQKEFVRELAKWMDEHGMGELASYAIAQIDDRGTWVPM